MIPTPSPLDRAPVLEETVFPPLPGAEPLPLVELTADACRWPVGPSLPRQRFCARPGAAPWCPEHARQARRR